MCGIAGFWDSPGEVGGVELKQLVLRMAATLRHRGPDDQGTWDWSLGLWHVLMFQAWFDQQKEMDVCRQ